MGCGKSKHDVAVGNTVSQSKRLSSESKKNVEANALAKETKNVVRETQVKGGEEKGVVKENAAEAKAAVEEKKSEGSPESKDSSGTEASSKGDGAKVEPENVTEEKTLVVEETKTVKENVEAEPEATKEENPIKEEAKVAAPSHDEEKAPNATGKVGNQTTEKVAETGSAASDPKTK